MKRYKLGRCALCQAVFVLTKFKMKIRNQTFAPHALCDVTYIIVLERVVIVILTLSAANF